MRFVHEECLKIWLASTGNDLLESKCELCKVEFEMEIKIEKTCVPKKCLKEGIGHCIFTPLLACVIGMLILIIYIILERFEQGD